MNRRDAETQRSEGGYPLAELSGIVVDAAIEVHRWLGPGHLESAYEEALAIELGLRKVPVERQVVISLDYKGHQVGQGKIDLLVSGNLIVELKAVEMLLPIHQAQVISYLRMTRRQVGLLINFNVPVLKQGLKRIVLSQTSASPRLCGSKED